MRITVVLIFLCWWNSVCNAQIRNFTLDSCIQYALQYRTEIKISENSGIQIAAEKKYLRQEQLPTLNGSYNHQLSWGRSLNMEKYEWENSKNRFGSMSLSSGLTLFAGLRLRYQLRAAKLNTARNLTEHRKLQDDIRLEVIQNFYELLAARANRDLYQSFYEKDCNREKRLEVLYSVNRLSDPDWEDSRAQTLKSLTSQRNAIKQYELALLKLKKSINYINTDSLLLVSPELPENIVVPSVETIYQTAIRILPQVILQQYDSLLLENRLKQLRSNFYPELSLLGTLYSRYQNNVIDPLTEGQYSAWKQIRDNNYKQVGISLSLPLYNRNSVRRQIRSVKTDKQNLQLSQNKLLTDVRFEVEQIHLEAESRMQNCYLLEKQEQSFHSIYELRQIQFENNKLTLYDLLTAEANWKNVQQELLIERFNLFCYLEMVNFYMNNTKVL